MPFTQNLKVVQLLLISLEEVTGRSSDKITVHTPLSEQIRLDGLQQVRFALQVDTHLQRVVPPGTFDMSMSLNEIARAIGACENIQGVAA